MARCRNPEVIEFFTSLWILSRGWYIQSPECFLFYSTVNSPQGTLLVEDSGHQLLDPYKTGMVGNILFFISLNPSLAMQWLNEIWVRTLPWWSVFPDVFCARLVPVRLVQIGSQGSKRWLRFSGQRPCFKGWWWWFSCSVESDSVTPWTVAHQTPLSVEFIRQECWSAVPFPSPEDLPNPRIKLVSLPSISRQVTTEPPGEPVLQCY